uniref:Uncharacterized protein n=1 Tax=Solanum lycopersicum TaxID=4081 RepID=A0A8F4XAF7_SOLLC|nr:hypothetical protein Solyc05g025570.1 [Solanum lycopersicum]
MRPGGMWNGDEPVGQSTRGMDQRGLEGWPKPELSIRSWNAVSPIVEGSACLWRSLASARSRRWPVGSPLDPS